MADRTWPNTFSRIAYFDRMAKDRVEELAQQLAESEICFGHDPDMWRAAAATALLSESFQREDAGSREPAPYTPPRYDDVFAAGAAALDQDGEDEDGAPGPDDDSDDAMWSVTRPGSDTATMVMGYNDGDRGRIAMHFASDDDAGWVGGTYDERLFVRRCKPNPESEPGVEVRVTVGIDATAVTEHTDHVKAGGMGSDSVTSIGGKERVRVRVFRDSGFTVFVDGLPVSINGKRPT
jgi:hypothetical protein